MRRLIYSIKVSLHQHKGLAHGARTSKHLIMQNSTIPLELFPYYNAITVISSIINVPHLVILIRLQAIRGHYKVFLYTVTIADCTMLAVRLCLFNSYAQDFLARHRAACAMSAVIGNALGIGVFSTLTLGAVDRWKAFTSRMYKLQWYVRNFKLVVIVLWMVAILLPAILAGIFYDRAFAIGGIGVCMLSSEQLPLLEPGLFICVICFLGQTILFGSILRKARGTMPLTKSRRSQQLKKQLTVVVICLLLIKWICWLPLIIMAVCRVAGITFPADIAKIMFTCNTALNPFAFGISLKTYRQEMQRVFCKCNMHASTADAQPKY